MVARGEATELQAPARPAPPAAEGGPGELPRAATVAAMAALLLAEGLVHVVLGHIVALHYCQASYQIHEKFWYLYL